MEGETQKKKRPVLDHVALTYASVEKIKKWLDQVSAKKKGVKISRKDFVNWLIEKSNENLSTGDINALIGKFYDEESFLRQLLRDVRQAKEDGQDKPSLEFDIKLKKTEPKKETTS